MSWRSLTDPSRCTRNETSASRGVLWNGRCHTRSTCATMFCKYWGKGNSTPSVLTVATSVPVDGFSPGSGATLGVVRGAASRFALSATGGGGAGETVLFGEDRKSTRLNSSHSQISYAVFCLKKKKKPFEMSKLHTHTSPLCSQQRTLSYPPS